MITRVPVSISMGTRGTRELLMSLLVEALFRTCCYLRVEVEKCRVGSVRRETAPRGSFTDVMLCQNCQKAMKRKYTDSSFTEPARHLSSPFHER